MEAAEGLPVTFHRAFDHTADPMLALEDIIDLTFQTQIAIRYERYSES